MYNNDAGYKLCRSFYLCLIFFDVSGIIEYVFKTHEGQREYLFTSGAFL